jgi:DNA invertase Pin-like site-specific DNA recombinase
MSTPTCAIELVRISDARNGDTHGVDGQVADLDVYAERIGWGIGPRGTHVIVENDISAFKRRKIPVPGHDQPVLRTVRPGFRRALDMLAAGQADGLLALDLDRACRDPRDLEDLIDVVESCRPRIPVESKSGSLRLANDADVTMARVLVAVGNKASRDTARRVSDQHRRSAAEGKFRGGRRRYGWERDGITPRLFAEPIGGWDGEQDVIRWAAESVLAGVSLRYLVRDLARRGVPTVAGADWSTSTLRDILLRPSTAGISVWTDPATGQRHKYLAGWAPVLPEDQWRAVCAILTDPARKMTPGNKPRWLGTFIYQCGACERDGRPLLDARGYTTVKVSGGRADNPTYHCATVAGSHLRRQALPVDDLVSRLITGRLARPDAADLLPLATRPDVDVRALRAEQAALRELLDEQARLHARRIIDERQLEAGSIEIRGKLHVIETQLEAAAPVSPLAGIAGRPDAADVWAGLDLGRKREIVKTLVTVTLLPMTGRLRGVVFDPDSVRIRWREKLDDELAASYPVGFLMRLH